MVRWKVQCNCALATVTRAGTGMAKNQRARPAACLSADREGAFGHPLTNVRGATALFPDMLLVEELAGEIEKYV